MYSSAPGPQPTMMIFFFMISILPIHGGHDAASCPP
jgi:hypothetical protein